MQPWVLVESELGVRVDVAQDQPRRRNAVDPSWGRVIQVARRSLLDSSFFLLFFDLMLSSRCTASSIRARIGAPKKSISRICCRRFFRREMQVPICHG